MGATEYRLTIKELPLEERPREKLIKYGVENLADAELLAILIRIGNSDKTAVELSQEILNFIGGFKGLNYTDINELTKIKGIGRAKAVQVLAAMELGRRLVRLEREDKVIIRSPRDVAQVLMPEMRYLTQEIFKIVLLDTKNQIISMPMISKGGLASSIVHPREVFKEAIRQSSAAMILAHNHPSGDPQPSPEDISITERLMKTGEILGIDVLDHIIIGDGVFLSMKEKSIV